MGTAAAQQIDFGLGFSGATQPTVSATGLGETPVNMGTGTWISLGANFLIKKHLGFGGEAAWRAKQNQFLNTIPNVGTFLQPFRPILYDFNGVYGAQLGKAAGVDLMAGIGGVSTRYYGVINCSFSGCVNYQSSNHFLGHFGGRLKLYPTKGNIFVAPEAHLYLIHNNVDVNNQLGLIARHSNYLTRFGIMFGYTFRPSE